MAPPGLLEDPRIRQTWNQFSSNAESATETAAAGIWTFQHRYINPCFSSVTACFEQCTGACFPDRDERARRARERGRTRGRAELSFDFYDDWDEDEGIGGGGLLGGWGNDELDRLLAGSGSNSGVNEGNQPKRKRGMSYGTNRARRRSLDPDPTIIPSTNTLGFLGRLPFKLGGTLRYKPSAADLQDHPGASRNDYMGEEGQPLIPEDDSDEDEGGKGHRRQRSSTTSSGATSDSFRSRGDLFPSDGEDDAIPLPDEFAMVLERRGTVSNADDKSSGKTRSSKGKRPAGLRSLSRTLSRAAHSSQSIPTLSGMRSNSEASDSPDIQSPGLINVPSLADLEQEEERIRLLEDGEVERKRQVAASLAIERGLQVGDTTDGMSESKPPIVETPPVDVEIEVENTVGDDDRPSSSGQEIPEDPIKEYESKDFVPARLPHFS
ncbi:hypothetical protein GLAREA_07451 [Glarea lozoyensis ATCC 20868]|uniref:Uncharacterized protein n=1 Tax=Glarea lozoyensis (strain ATCC 20868 / MF5171) TaxID=1116229 RepID=S3E1G9_GLAL2|nr:uncharacterized protein GLAREA_07451 [Glarea lozoyensis ATCC 20868]EPE32318.1 hypothetical protein GLAREA_07451 [Glarea lozoyensis ATCC 20868]